MEYTKLHTLRKQLRRLRKQLKERGGHRLIAEINALIGDIPPFRVCCDKNKPLIASAVYDSLKSGNELNTDSVAAALTPYRDLLNNADFMSLMWQIRFAALMYSSESSVSSDLIYTAADVDAEYINEHLNPLCIKYRSNDEYMMSSEKTKAMLRADTSRAAQAADIDERRLAAEYIAVAGRSEAGLAEVIKQDLARIFPKTNTIYYIIVQTVAALAISAITVILAGWFAGITVFTPALAAAKTIIDNLLLRGKKAGEIPMIKLSEAEKHEVVCVLSALISSEEDVIDGLKRLRRARLKNTSPNIKFCLLCDLPPAKEMKSADDERIIAASEKAYELSDRKTSVIFRERSFCKTQRKYQGRERKRGAIEDLVRYMNGDEVKFRAVFGEISDFKNVPFICALDYDTLPLMDSINSLVAAACHPCNSEYGIFAPRITTSLSSSLRTGLTRLFGTGGCSGASVYDNISSELYFDCFGEGTFTGKGLIRTEKYYKECIGRFPEERVLSHDILEGGILGTAYCGEVEFSDGLPPTTKGYFKRQHRWMRGDFQNFPYVFDKNLSPLTKFKLSDNVRRALTPFNAVMTLFVTIYSETLIPAVVALLSVTLPYIFGLIPAAIKGLGFSNTREFYSPITSLSRQLVSQIFAEIIFLGKNALSGLDALVRSAWRMLTKRNLLEWQTASAFDKTGNIGYAGMIPASLLGIALMTVSVIAGNVFTAITGIFMLFALPAAVICDRTRPQFLPYVKEKDRERLVAQAKKQWNFYTDYVTKEENWLPPDNVQYSPVYRVTRRTSPTNIGMYLLSCVCAYELGFIDTAKLENLVEKTIRTVERLPKYKGNLYNWYSTEDLSVSDPFVSSVDSGNLLCCLVAVKAELSEVCRGCGLTKRIDKLIREADISIFYNRPRRLFSVGINADTGKKAPNCYDMLMSEARMLSFFAIAEGKADKSHWRSLSRIMSRSGYYAGPVAWSGTMFEYFMPELLLESKKGSLCYEALGYAVHCQRERGRERHLPFGISESGYFAFDRDLNYQYKAHGVQKLALCGGMDKEYVISPYSTFLALGHSFSECMKNLTKFDSDEEFEHEKYGYYEAIDLSRRRTGSSAAVVKSHMAHHIGMSMGGITNALCGGRLRELFMSDETMQRADELLEERVMSGEIIVDIEKLRDRSAVSEYKEEYTEFSVLRPRFNIIANRKLSLFVSDTGLYYGRYGEEATAFSSPDYLRRPDGMFFGFSEGSTIIPFYMNAYNCGKTLRRSIIFDENSTEYYTDSVGLACGMKLELFGENAAEIRSFAVENRVAAERRISLYGYIRPALAAESAVKSHPAFADMFLSPQYDDENKLALICRRDRNSGRETWMAVGFRDSSDFIYSFSRENVMTHEKPADFSKGLELTASDDRSIPAPCVFIKRDIKLSAGQKYDDVIFICYGKSKNEVIGISGDIRRGEEPAEPVSPLPKSTLAGQLARRMLPAALCANVYSEEILSAKSKLDTAALWKFGISGDNPISVYYSDGDEIKCEAAVSMSDRLNSCGIINDVIILCRNSADKTRAELVPSIGRKCVFPIMLSELSEEELNFILKSAVYVLGKTEERKAPEKLMDIVDAEPVKLYNQSGIPIQDNGFLDDSYVITGRGYSLCNVLASSEFGCILSRNSLGFSYAMNSRENKLTPWYNDIMHDNNGELLLVKGIGRYFDIIGGSTAVFAPNRAEYRAQAGHFEFKTEVRVYEKGMGKRIRVYIENDSSTEKQCAISYYTEPVLGADRKASNYGAKLSCREDERSIYIRNDSNPDFKGEMAVSCDRECVKTTNRERFLAGEVNGEVKPFAQCCAAVTAKVRVAPHSTSCVNFTLSYSCGDAAKQLPAFDKTAVSITRELTPTIKSGSDTLDRLYNNWLPWQVLGCRMWARSGFYQNGGAFGFRDQLQDSTAAVYFMPKEAKRQILRCCASQFPAGDVLHWWHKTNNGRKGVRTKCSDDMLWLPFAVEEYCRITKDRSILDIPVRYITGEELGSESEKYITTRISDAVGSVYEHCKKALDRCYRTGSRSLIKIGSGDWNDGYSKVGSDGLGESVWLSMFYIITAKKFAPIARENGDSSYSDELEKRAAALTVSIEDEAFENGYYLRAFYDDGRKMGAKDNDVCRIDLLPQAFAELAALPDKEKRRSALRSALSELVNGKNRLIQLFNPPFSSKYPEDPGYVRGYPEGVRENGGQYTHAAVWLALAVLHSGDMDKTLELTDMLNPAERGEEYKNEPYYMSADIYTNPECLGRGGWSIYTGAAGWYYRLLGEIFGSVPLKR